MKTKHIAIVTALSEQNLPRLKTLYKQAA